jgi:hypothetical protein
MTFRFLNVTTDKLLITESVFLRWISRGLAFSIRHLPYGILKREYSKIKISSLLLKHILITSPYPFSTNGSTCINVGYAEISRKNIQKDKEASDPTTTYFQLHCQGR